MRSRHRCSDLISCAYFSPDCKYLKRNQIAIKGDIYMKATGIVRRIDARVIIGQTRKSRINTGFFADFVQNIKQKSAAFASNFARKRGT